MDITAPIPPPLSRTQYVLEAMKHAILAGQLTPGSPLVETELAAQFGVSKTPVREALKTLAGTGLVVMSQYKGVTVRMVDAAMAASSMTYGCCWSRRRCAAPSSRRLRSTRRARRWSGPTTAADPAERSLANRDFHRSLYVGLRQPAARAGCSTSSGTRPRWSPPSPGQPSRPGSRRPPSTRRSSRLAARRGRRRRSRAACTRTSPRSSSARFRRRFHRKAEDDMKRPSDVRDTTRGAGGRGGDPGDPVHRGRPRRSRRLRRARAQADRRRQYAPSPRTATPASSTPSTPAERRTVVELDRRRKPPTASRSWPGSVHDLPTAVAAARARAGRGRLRW